MEAVSGGISRGRRKRRELRARQAWNWLHSLTHPDEGMLVRVRSSRRIDLYHPASRDSAGVTTIWRNRPAGSDDT